MNNSNKATAPKHYEYSNINIYWDEWAKKHPEIVNARRKIILRQGQSPG